MIDIGIPGLFAATAETIPHLTWVTSEAVGTVFYPGDFRQFSLDRFDPEWRTVWDETPIEVYGAIAPTGDEGGNQPSQIGPVDAPPTHYGHDASCSFNPIPPIYGSLERRTAMPAKRIRQKSAGSKWSEKL
jgi:hypothetical protein